MQEKSSQVWETSQYFYKTFALFNAQFILFFIIQSGNHLRHERASQSTVNSRLNIFFYQDLISPNSFQALGECKINAHNEKNERQFDNFYSNFELMQHIYSREEVLRCKYPCQTKFIRRIQSHFSRVELNSSRRNIADITWFDYVATTEATCGFTLLVVRALPGLACKYSHLPCRPLRESVK